MKHKMVLVLVAVMLLASTLVATIAQAETGPAITFEPSAYTVGSIDGQDGWSKTNPNFDVAVAPQQTYPTFGSQSLRISNAVTSGSFGDQTFSKPLVNEAGEASAANGAMSGGDRQTIFEAQWDFASVTQTYQAGLSVVASPDRGDGARMSWIEMADTDGGLAVNFYDYQADYPEEYKFVLTNVASNLDRTAPHTIKVTMEFIDGPANDIVTVSVDDTYFHTGTSWEDYFRNEEENPTRTVDSILFRTGGTAAPNNQGNGFLIDNFQISSGGYTIEDLRDATDELVTNPRAALALLASLNRIEMYADRGNSFFAYLSMLQFVLLVDRYEDARQITPAAAQELLTLAMQVRDSLF